MSFFRQTFSAAQQQQQQQRPGPSALPPPTQWVTHEDREIIRVGGSQYRVSVNSIEHIPYVCLSHWWFNKSQATWFPSRKQIFLPKSAWLALVEHSAAITQIISPLNEPEDPG